MRAAQTLVGGYGKSSVGDRLLNKVNSVLCGEQETSTWVFDFIDSIKNDVDNPYGDDDEAIADGIIRYAMKVTA